ncbi:MAG: hypothetical protein HC828_02065 [Blastochloris sp.]|nr:hypothetical protein [Blastochloris sp.]
MPIGKDGMETLRAMAKIRQRDPEALAAELLSAALAAEWAEYDQSVTEWSGEIL